MPAYLRIRLIVAALALWAGLSNARAQGTAFTYQGRLNEGGRPANGTYDFQLTVCDAVVGGHGLGEFPLLATAVVSNGWFALTADPGSDVFTGEARWLNLAVRTNGPGTFVNLTPRQSINATPYAITAGQLTGPVAPENIAPGTITSTMLAPGSVTSAQLDPALAEALASTPWARANVLSATNALDFQNRTGSQPADQVAALIAVTNANPLFLGSSLTVSGDTSLGALEFNGGYASTFRGGLFNFSRTDRSQDSSIRFYTEGEETNAFQMGMDNQPGQGDFFAMAFVEGLRGNVMRVGTSGDGLGKFGMGAAAVVPGSQLAIVDINNSVSNSVLIQSWVNGLSMLTLAPYSDAIRLNRQTYDCNNWICWSSQDGTAADWRIGPNLDHSHDLTIYQELGGNSDPATPGTEFFRLTRANGDAIIRGNVTAAGFVGEGSSLSNLSADALAFGTVPDARLSANVALVSQLTNYASAAQLADYTTSAQVAAQIAAINTNPLILGSSLTVSGDTSLGALEFDGGYASTFRGGLFNFSRTDRNQDSSIRFYTEGEETNAFQMGMDNQPGQGDFFAMAFVEGLHWDVMRVGTCGDGLGKFGMGAAGVIPGAQLAIADINNSVSNSVFIQSYVNGLNLLTLANSSDAIRLNRQSYDCNNWICWSSLDDTAADWRIGPNLDHSHDLTIYQELGGNSDPATPGTEYFRLTRANGDAIVKGSVTAAGFVGDGSSLSNLSADALAIGTVPDARLSANVALVSQLTNYAPVTQLADYTTPAQVAAQIADTNTNPLCLGSSLTVTNGRTTLGSLYFDGDESSFSGRIFNYIRSATNIPSDVRWYTEGNHQNYFSMGPDFGTTGDFFALAFVGGLQLDAFRVGTDGDVMGKFAMGTAGVLPGVQFALADINGSVSNSLFMQSWRNGIDYCSRSQYSDALTMHRGDYTDSIWLCWAQGDGAADWRIGPNLDHSHDLTIYQELGGTSDPSTPGTEYLRISRDTGDVSVPQGRLVARAVATTNATVFGHLIVNGASLAASSNQMAASVPFSAPAFATPGVVNATNGFAVGPVVGISSTQVVMTSFTTYATNVFINGILVSTTYKKLQ